MSCGVGCGIWLPEVCVYWEKILATLLEDGDLVAQLVHLFHSEEQTVAHLAAKASSCCVSFQLQTSGVVCAEWAGTCVQAFQNGPSGCDVGACLWSLTDVCKKLLKGAQQESLRKLLLYFDCSLRLLCSKFLPEERGQVDQSHWGTSFCLLLDLLEVLTIAAGHCGPGSSLRSPSGLQRHSCGLLEASCSSPHSYSRRKVVVLLKRAALQRLGEDLGLGSWSTRSSQHNSDQLQLAGCVLAALNQDWLGKLEVSSASYFGGCRDGELSADGVTVRAASLLVLKSVELHLQDACGGAAGLEGVAAVVSVVGGSLGALWGFLRRCSGLQLCEASHRCCWLSLLFGEQDDDMLEAAKALLSIFISLRWRSGLDEVSVLETSCASGFNPHCHFLFLLQSISFDHSILLDFLISTETCFLEYFVRYLKVLRDDWLGFTAACGAIAATGGGPLQPSLRAPSGGEEPAGVSGGRPNGALNTTCEPPAGLVDYDSSGESDSESTEASEPGPGSPSETWMSRRSPQQTSDKALQSLSRLSQLLTRLHARKLFPYNPASLLRLLLQVQSHSQQTVTHC